MNSTEEMRKKFDAWWDSTDKVDVSSYTSGFATSNRLTVNYREIAFEGYQQAVKDMEAVIAELTKQRTNLQLQLEQEREIQKRSGLMLSSALRGYKRSDEQENGRLDAVRELVKQRDEAVTNLGMAIWRIKDMLIGDDGQAWKEAEKFLDTLSTQKDE